MNMLWCFVSEVKSISPSQNWAKRSVHWHLFFFAVIFEYDYVVNYMCEWETESCLFVHASRVKCCDSFMVYCPTGIVSIGSSRQQTTHESNIHYKNEQNVGRILCAYRYEFQKNDFVAEENCTWYFVRFILVDWCVSRNCVTCFLFKIFFKALIIRHTAMNVIHNI